MGVSLSELSPKAREQVLAKFAVDQVRKQKTDVEQKPNKYHAQKINACLEDGTPHTFDSVKEFDRYRHLIYLQKTGEIGDLRLQVKYSLVPAQKLSDGKTLRGVDYVADFVYEQGGKTVVEDVKGYRDPASAAYAKYVIKKKLMKWIHDVEVVEV